MQVFGFCIFLMVIGMAFWMLIFLVTFLPYMATLLITERFNPELANKLAFICEDDC